MESYILGGERSYSLSGIEWRQLEGIGHTIDPFYGHKIRCKNSLAETMLQKRADRGRIEGSNNENTSRHHQAVKKQTTQKQKQHKTKQKTTLTAKDCVLKTV